MLVLPAAPGVVLAGGGVVVLVPLVVLLVLPIDEEELLGEVAEFGLSLGLLVVVPAAPVVSVVVPVAPTPALGLVSFVPAA